MKRALRVAAAIHREGKKENKRKNSGAPFLIHDRRNNRHCERRGSRSAVAIVIPSTIFVTKGQSANWATLTRQGIERESAFT